MGRLEKSTWDFIKLSILFFKKLFFEIKAYIYLFVNKRNVVFSNIFSSRVDSALWKITGFASGQKTRELPTCNVKPE